jgi:hypothetical protein
MSRTRPVSRSLFSPSLILTAFMSLAFTAGCDVAPDEDNGSAADPSGAPELLQQTLEACSSACKLTESCRTGCSVNETATTCEVYTLGRCGMPAEDPAFPPGDNGGGGGPSGIPRCEDVPDLDICRPQGINKLIGQEAVRNKVQGSDKNDPRYTTRIISFYARGTVSSWGQYGCTPIRCRCDDVISSNGGRWLGPPLPTRTPWPGKQSRSWGDWGACKHY